MWKSSGLLDSIAGGKVTVGTVPGSKFDGMAALPGDVLGIVLGLGFIALAFALPERLTPSKSNLQPAE